MIQYMSPLINDFYLVNLSTVEVILLLYGKITLNRSIKLLLFLYSVTEACQTLRVHGLCQASLSFIISKSVLKLMFIESVMPSNHFILCLFFCLQSFPGSASFPISWLFTSDGQSTEASASSVLPMNIQDQFHLGWTGWISLLAKRLSRVFPSTTVEKLQFFGAQLFLWPNSHICT